MATILLALTVEDDERAADLAGALRTMFASRNGRAVTLSDPATRAFFASAIVGLDGADDGSGFSTDVLDEAWRALSSLAADPVVVPAPERGV
jgi:hypothetical protein